MPLTSVLGGQGHCKLRHSIDRIRVPVVCGHILYAYCFPGKAIVENRDFSYPLLLQQPRGKKRLRIFSRRVSQRSARSLSYQVV